MRQKQYLAIGALLMLAAVIYWWTQTGKVDAGKRVALKGRVSIDGKPLASGRIEFRPQSETTGPAAFGTVEKGSFSIAAAEGILPGGYEVKVSLSRMIKGIKKETLGGLPIPSAVKPNTGNQQQRKVKVENDAYLFPEALIVPPHRRELTVDFDFPSNQTPGNKRPLPKS